MASVKRFEDLVVWQNARSLAKDVYDATRGDLFSKDFALCRQIRAAALSVAANIAEGFERGSNKEFVQALFISKGSAGEVRSFLYSALDLGYVSQSAFDGLVGCCEGISRQIMSLVDYLRRSDLKGDKFREERVLYEVHRPGDFEYPSEDFDQGHSNLQP